MPDPDHRRPTMRDVAERAGVSFKTVSRVVNHEGGVRPEPVDSVRAAVAELGYRPDDRARRLRQGDSRAGTIGFVLVDIANPFFSSIMRGIEAVAQEHDTLLLAASTDGDQDRENQIVNAFVARRVDGLIVVSSGSADGPLAVELDRGSPVVFLDLEPSNLRGDLVRGDHFGGSVLATEHLLAHGHVDIAFFGDESSVFSARLRREGFCEAMHAAGLRVDDERIVHGRHTDDVWREIIRDYMRRPKAPTAMFTAQNFVTLGAVGALHDLDLHHRVAMVGFDEITLADAIEPGITTVPQHPLELGRAAARQLFARIEGSDEPFVHLVAPSTVIERGSGEIRPDQVEKTVEARFVPRESPSSPSAIRFIT